MTKALPNQIYLKQIFYEFKMDENKSIDEHIDEFTKLLSDECLNVRKRSPERKEKKRATRAEISLDPNEEQRKLAGLVKRKVTSGEIALKERLIKSKK